MSSHIIGIDVGGTNVKAGLFNADGDIIEWKKTPSLIHKGKQAFLEKISRIVINFEKKTPSIYPVLGIVVPGIIDKKRECVIHSPNLPGWDNFPIKHFLNEKLSMDIKLENDANGAALGELWKGAGKDLSNFMLLTLGTGLGSGLVLDKKLWTGEDGKAAEIGHTKIVPDGIRCDCGAKGCLEKYFSSSAIERIAKNALKSRKKTKLSWQPLTPKTVYEAARNGDAVALEIYREISRYLGIAIANVINLLGIKHFILSGGISNAANLFIPFLEYEIGKNLFYPFSKDFTIEKGKLGNRAGATGAAYLALKSVSPRRTEKVHKNNN